MLILVQMMKTRESYDREWRIWGGVGWGGRKMVEATDKFKACTFELCMIMYIHSNKTQRCKRLTDELITGD